MTTTTQRPETVGRATSVRLGARASCLLVILAANQAAARDMPTSLPYLPHAAPMGLRFAAAPPRLPPPPRPISPTAGISTAPKAEQTPPENPSASVVGTNPVGQGTNGTAPGQSPPANGSPAGSPPEPVPATVPTTVADPAKASANNPDQTQTNVTPTDSSNSSLMPDTYARPSPVTVQDFLPFFLPSERPRSRATYEIK